MSLRDQLQQIHSQHRELTPRLVVDVARDTSHPLHDRFEWDDSVAGEKYREVQAADLIRSVKVKFVSGDEERDVRAFVAMRQPESEASSYEPIEDVANDDIGRTILLRRAEREWRTFQRKYAHLAEFFDQIRGELADTA